MVANVTSLTGNGLRDWGVQRLSALVIAAYVVVLLGFMMCCGSVTFELWQQFFHCMIIRIFSILFLFALILHAWVGVWTISTDYLKVTWLRLGFQLGFAGLLVACLAWGVDIFWGM